MPFRCFFEEIRENGIDSRNTHDMIKEAILFSLRNLPERRDKVFEEKEK